MSKLLPASLVLYKIRPARVKEITDKIEIELEGGKTKRVRDKDITLLHPGPLVSLKDLTPRSGEVEENWELLEGSTTEIRELTELIFGDYTPATAWAAWQLVEEGVYFEGTPESINPRPAEAVQDEQERRARKAQEEQAWNAFVKRVEQGSILEEDRKPLGEVEMLALGRREGSRLLNVLNIQETPVNAHRLLVKTGYWSPDENPYPRRQGINEATPDFAVPDLPQEQRVDLTHLAAYAIDDEDNEDPDDAISLDGERIWVHVADVAALVEPDSEMDLDARSRGSNLYLPEKVIPMLPQQVTDKLGLGLEAESPALSISFKLSEQGEISETQIHLSRLRVQRISYAEADLCMQEAPFAELLRKSRIYRERRRAAGAAFIQLPEVKIRVKEGQVEIHPLPALDSREMVTDLMLMAGEAVARYCLEKDIPAPFAAQAPPNEPATPEGMAAMYAYVRKFKPTQVKTQPELHAGLGIETYTRSTSPLRRYSDLLVHQQLRAHLQNREVIDIHTLSERLSQAEMGSMTIRKTERLSNNHWRLIYLRDNPEWQGEAVVVAREGERTTVVIPALGMDSRVRIKSAPDLNDIVQLKPREVNLPGMSCYFRII
ncbi:MAG: RNB domain-containing ribonuclease [Pseudomonadota bacterium]